MEPPFARLATSTVGALEAASSLSEQAALNEATPCLYAIDPHDRIVSVGANWSRFALENDAPELVEERVVGQPIWRYISGVQTRNLYLDLFRRLRRNPAEMLVPFRCDSPRVIREMTLLVSSSVDGTIRFEGRVHRVTEREEVTALSRFARRTEDTLEICAVCRRLSVEDIWMEATADRARERLFHPDRSPGLDETVCPDCHASIAATKPSAFET